MYKYAFTVDSAVVTATSHIPVVIAVFVGDNWCLVACLSISLFWCVRECGVGSGHFPRFTRKLWINERKHQK